VCWDIYQVSVLAVSAIAFDFSYEGASSTISKKLLHSATNLQMMDDWWLEVIAVHRRVVCLA